MDLIINLPIIMSYKQESIGNKTYCASRVYLSCLAFFVISVYYILRNILNYAHTYTFDKFANDQAYFWILHFIFVSIELLWILIDFKTFAYKTHFLHIQRLRLVPWRVHLQCMFYELYLYTSTLFWIFLKIDPVFSGKHSNQKN